MLIFNKNINTLATWILVVNLSTHFFFFHGMFDSNVICFEKDGSTNIEYSLDGKTCIVHGNQLKDKIVSFTSAETDDCEDISFSESNHNDDQFVIKKIEKSFSNTNLVSSSPINLSVKRIFTIAFKNFSTIQSNSIQQLKTVSLLI